MRGRGRRDAHGARDRARPDHQRRLRRLRRRRRRRAPAATRPGTASVSLAWTALTPSHDRRRDLRPQHRDRLDELPRGGRRRSPCPRRTSCTPTATATSATRRPAWSRSASPATTASSRRRAGCSENDWTGDYVPFDGAAQRARPRRGVRGDRQPGRHRAGLPLLPDRRLGPAATAPSGSATCSSGGSRTPARCRSTTWPRSSSTPAARSRRRSSRACSPSTCRAATGRAGQRHAAALGLRPARRQRPAEYFNVVWRTLLDADVPRRDARGRLAERRRPLDRRDGRAARRPDVGLVGRQGDDRGRDPRRHPAPWR